MDSYIYVVHVWYNTFDDKNMKLLKHEIGLIKFQPVSFHSCPVEAIMSPIKPDYTNWIMMELDDWFTPEDISLHR